MAILLILFKHSTPELYLTVSIDFTSELHEWHVEPT